MADPRDLFTLAELENYLNSNSPNFNTGAITQILPLLITAVSQDWLTFTGRRSLNRFIPCNDFFDGSTGDRQFLRDFPAALVGSVYIDGQLISEGGWDTSGGVVPGWALDSKRESISLVGLNIGGGYGLGRGAGSGGSYAATGGPLTRVYSGMRFGRPGGNRQDVQIQYFAGGSIMKAETLLIPASGPYTVTVSQAALFYCDLANVYYSLPQNGQLVQMTQVATPTAVGEYSVVNGVYTFFSGDAGQYVAIDYAYNAAPPEVKAYALMQAAETVHKRKTLGLKSQSDKEGGTTTYTWDLARPPIVMAVMEKYKRAMVGM